MAAIETDRAIILIAAPMQCQCAKQLSHKVAQKEDALVESEEKAAKAD